MSIDRFSLQYALVHIDSPFDQWFPGPAPEILEPSTGEMTLTLGHETWQSTGLWLPTGSVGVIECDEPQPDINVQIGSHQEVLTNKAGP